MSPLALSNMNENSVILCFRFCTLLPRSRKSPWRDAIPPVCRSTLAATIVFKHNDLYTGSGPTGTTQQ